MDDSREGMSRRGRPRNSPEDATTQFAIRLTASEKSTLRTLAKRDGIPMATYVAEVLRAHMRDEGV